MGENLRTLDPHRICRLFLSGWSVARLSNASGYSESRIEEILRTDTLAEVRAAMVEEGR